MGVKRATGSRLTGTSPSERLDEEGLRPRADRRAFQSGKTDMKRGFWLVIVLIGNGAVVAADDDFDFFEAKIRPLLVKRCLECHQGEKTSGGLALDTRQGWQTGGDSGPAVVPGKPDESLLIKAVRYTDDNVQMPPQDRGGKLPDAEIALLQEWVRRGAADPRVAAVKIGGMTPEQAKSWWAFQPIAEPPLPATDEFRCDHPQ